MHHREEKNAKYELISMPHHTVVSYLLSEVRISFLALGMIPANIY